MLEQILKDIQLGTRVIHLYDMPDYCISNIMDEIQEAFGWTSTLELQLQFVLKNCHVGSLTFKSLSKLNENLRNKICIELPKIERDYEEFIQNLKFLEISMPKPHNIKIIPCPSYFLLSSNLNKNYFFDDSHLFFTKKNYKYESHTSLEY
jgi:hypothetical protein